MTRSKAAEQGTAGTKGTGIYNVEVCTMAPGMPLGLNVRVSATSVEDARRRCHEILYVLYDGTTVLRPGDHDLTDGESVRLYVDVDMIVDHGHIEFEGD